MISGFRSSSLLKFYTVVLVLGWSGAVVASLFWNLYLFRQEVKLIALSVARTQIKAEILYRRWNALQGGVYVPVTPDNRPDPFLAGVKERDLVTPSGQRLTLSSHGRMTSQVQAMGRNEQLFRGSITSLTPLNNNNRADPWEQQVLRSFEKGEVEASGVVVHDGREYLRLMRPVLVEKSCLKCHARQGYAVGNIRGGITVEVPLAPLGETLRGIVNSLWVGHILFWLLGMFGILLSYSGMQRRNEQRQEAEAEMNRMRLYLQNMIDAMPSVLIGVDLAGRITQWNNEAARVTGLDAAAAQGLFLPEVMPMFAEQMARIKKAMREKKPLRIERLLCRLHNEPRYVDVITYPLIFNEVEEAIIRLDDVTDRVRVEDETIQTEKLTSVASLVEGMAHELNNPLGGIMQGAQSVLRRVSPQLPQNVEAARRCDVDLDKLQSYLADRHIFKFLEGIQASGLRAAHIVTYLLQFSRDREAAKEYTSMPALVDRAVELVKHDKDLVKRVDWRRLEIVREYQPGLPRVFCSVSGLEQVLLNLIKNAVQAMTGTSGDGPAPKTMRIILRIRTEGENELIRIEVEDNGPGMDETTMRRVFEPFFTTKPPGEGTGLGLAVTYFIVTMTHRGSLGVKSADPGSGAIFTIRLPLVGPGLPEIG
ncbi:MAG: DUF3365 domain-containing protein [Desulfobacterales bacterium]|nr:DUF3365 domain-containing protein [Desulfobacterales bacterium]